MKIINELGAAENRQVPAAEGTEALKFQANDNANSELNATPMLPLVTYNKQLSVDELLYVNIDGSTVFSTGKFFYDRNGQVIDFKPFDTIDNTRRLLAAYGFGLSYNLITRSMEISGTPAEWGNTRHDTSTALTYILDIAKRNNLKLNKDQLTDYTYALSRRNQYNPIYDLMSNIKWDGIDRLDMLVNSIESENTPLELIKLLLTKWLISAVALGCAAEDSQFLSAGGVLILVGSQGNGKNQFLHWLTKPFSDYFLEGHTLIPGEKDSISTFVKYWIVELGELDGTLSKAHMPALKAILTNDKDVFRPSYGRTDVIYRRRTVFAASINHEMFLEDKTGSRRFWAIDFKAFNITKELDVLQLWAQVYQLYLDGHSWHLNAQEQQLLELSNAKHKAIDVIDDGLSNEFNFDANVHEWTIKRTSNEILERLGFDKPTVTETRRLTESLKARRVKMQESTRDGKRGRYWLMPPSFTSYKDHFNIVNDIPTVYH